MDRSHFLAHGVVLFGLVFLSACAANNLSEPIGAFKQVTDQAASGLEKQQTAINKEIFDEATDAALKQDFATVNPLTGDCGLTGRCRLFVKVDAGAPWPYSSGAFDDGVIALMDQVQAYVANLSAIASAGTPAEIDNATAKVKANTLALAGTIDAIQKQRGVVGASLQSTITPFAAPVTELVTFGLQQYVEAKRRAAIREAAHEMQPVLDDAVLVFNEVMSESFELKRNALAGAFQKARDDYRADPHDKTKLTAYKNAAEALDGVLVAKPETMFTDLAKAHAALVRALDMKDLSFAEVWPLLRSVAENATKLASIAQEFEAIELQDLMI